MLAALGLGRCSTTSVVTVTGFNLDSGLPGFGCDGYDGGLLTRRAGGSQGGRFVVVLDALDFGDEQPPCISVSLDSYCASKPNGCPIVKRGCWPMNLGMLGPGDAGLNGVQAGFQYLHSIDAGLDDLPLDRNLVLRVMAFAVDDCDAGTSLRPQDEKATIMGCSRSCPAPLGSTSAVDLYLDVPPNTQACEDEVLECGELELLHAP